MNYLEHITGEEIERLPYVSFGGKITLVEKLSLVPAMVEYLLAQSVLGYDTETQPCFTKGDRHRMSLVQLSSGDEAFLIRVDKIGFPAALIPVLQSPDIIKVGAAIHDDIKGMQRMHRFTPRGFIDLQKYVEQFGILDKAVKKMAAIVLQLRISKSQQTSNWARKRYTEEQKKYAATDAWVCREIYLGLQKNSE
ncbi:3'-5' exonuclease [Bacteroidia bacterium]|nr:3'-5' exonuclease [Bacteroidia bacterium]